VSNGSDRRLTSWKEIASYFGVNVRTVQKWEVERALPVHRLPGKRGLVTASVLELEDWKRAGDGNRNGTAVPDDQEIPTGDARGGSRPVVLRWSVVAVVLVALVAVLWRGVGSPRVGPPMAWRIDQDTLVVSDGHGREVFRQPFGRLHAAQYAGPDAFGHEYALVRDVDADGHVETLFVREPPILGLETSELYCFSDDGSVRWTYAANREVRTSAKSFRPSYKILNFWVGQLTKDGPTSIILVCTHDPYYPTQVALLSPDGLLQGEYWHSGHIGLSGRLLVLDLDGDGVREILLGGISNGYKQATLVVLDPRTMAGASAEASPEFQLIGFPPGREKARLWFPRSCMSRTLDVYNHVRFITEEPDGFLVHVYETSDTTAPVVHYHLNRSLALRELAFSATFERRHLELESAGVLKHHWTTAEKQEMERIQRLPTGLGPGVMGAGK